jgi:hypothetical protein
MPRAEASVPLLAGAASGDGTAPPPAAMLDQSVVGVGATATNSSSNPTTTPTATAQQPSSSVNRQSSREEIDVWLARINLSTYGYEEALKQEGYDNVAFLQGVDDAEAHRLANDVAHMKVPHRKAFLAALKALPQAEASVPLLAGAAGGVAPAATVLDQSQMPQPQMMVMAPAPLAQATAFGIQTSSATPANSLSNVDQSVEVDTQAILASHQPPQVLAPGPQPQTMTTAPQPPQMTAMVPQPPQMMTTAPQPPHMSTTAPQSQMPQPQMMVMAPAPLAQATAFGIQTSSATPAKSLSNVDQSVEVDTQAILASHQPPQVLAPGPQPQMITTAPQLQMPQPQQPQHQYQHPQPQPQFSQTLISTAVTSATMAGPPQHQQSYNQQQQPYQQPQQQYPQPQPQPQISQTLKTWRNDFISGYPQSVPPNWKTGTITVKVLSNGHYNMSALKYENVAQSAPLLQGTVADDSSHFSRAEQLISTALTVLIPKSCCNAAHQAVARPGANPQQYRILIAYILFATIACCVAAAVTAGTGGAGILHIYIPHRMFYILDQKGKNARQEAFVKLEKAMEQLSQHNLQCWSFDKNLAQKKWHITITVSAAPRG